MKKRNSGGSMTTVLLDLDLEESSSDSDFRIEDHDNESDDFSDDNSNEAQSDNEDDNENENSSNEDDDDSDADFSNFKDSLNSSSGKGKKSQSSMVVNDTVAPTLSAKQLLQQAKAKEALDRANAKLLATPICCACLGDRSDDTNEIVECDNCGISVHEGCYGISDSNSVSSTVSSCSTEPWFCEACKANVDEPVCELCPNKGGIFKETDVGKWVHLVCALYVPGVAFGEVDHLSSVTLFEMPYSKWGAKSCSLCEDVRFARTGVCIGCDAGMCKTYFHVTCAQAAGLLSEAHSEEADHADPFYAHCKIHSDKALIKHRKRNFNGLQLKLDHRLNEQVNKKMEQPSVAHQRIERKLKKHRNKYISNKQIKSEPWVPTQKMPRLLTTSASACRKLILKAELMGIDTAALEFQEAQMAALADVRKKWHIPPAFSVEFIGYYLDRISRLREIKVSLQDQLELNKKLVDEQQLLRDQYDENVKIQSEHSDSNTSLKESIEKLHATIRALCPNKNMPTIENIGRAPAVVAPVVVTPPILVRPMSVPTAAALKMGVGFPLTNLPGTNEDTNRILSTQCQNNSKLMHECGICKRCNDQHLLAKCDTCHLHYHLGCLNPPLTRHPKKSKLYGWQCSECVKSDDSDGAVTLPVGPRKSRTKYSKDGTIVPVDPPALPPTSSTDVSFEDSKLDIKFTEAIQSPSNQPQVVLIKTIINSPNKKVEKRPSTVERNEEIVLATSPTIEPVHGSKVKKIKTTNNDSSMTMNDALLQYPSPEDPLDISKSPIVQQQVVKTKSNKKIKREKSNALKQHHNSVNLSPTAPTYYIDQNGMLKTIESASPPPQKTGHFTSELIACNNSKAATNPTTITTTTSTTNQQEQNHLNHKQNRKRRKDKHRNKHGNGDGESRSQSKEHKKKRKKKSHDREMVNNQQYATEGIPRIKIKFKALPIPGEPAAEPHFIYVSADMVRPMEICRSTRPATVDPIVKQKLIPQIQQTSNHPQPSVRTKQSPAMPTTSTPLAPIRARRLSVLCSPKKFKSFTNSTVNNTPKETNSTNASSNNISGTGTKCDVCNEPGTNQDLVRCDECKKNYHFQCLEPPVKKTPKRRGYSWHCADCDPTDIESN